MKIRTETPADLDRIREVITAAFGDPGEAALIDALRADESWIPDLVLVAAADDGRVIAHSVITRATIGEVRALTLAVVSVDPAQQGTGIGTQLIRAGLDAARERGEHTITVLGHPGYYPRFGFEPAADHGVTCTLSKGPDAGKMVLALDATPIPQGDMGFGKPLAEAIAAYQPE